MVSIQRSPPGSLPSTRRSAAIWTVRLLSSTTWPGHAASISVSFETNAPGRSTNARNKAIARWPSAIGSLPSGSEPMALGQRAIALLRALVERPGALVSKDTLIEAAWPGQVVEESNLTVQIAALRRVLGKEPGGERWIETLSRRGYRFVGPVVAQGAIASPPQIDVARDPAPTPRG